MNMIKTTLFILFINCTVEPSPYCIITHPPYKAGFFSLFHMVLGTLLQYEALDEWSGLEVNFGSKGYYYQQEYGDNWWNYYFEPIKIGIPTRENKIDTLTYPQYMHFSFYAQFSLPREAGHYLIKKYIKIRPHIEKKLNAFTTTHFTDKFVIGIHYRGTDKDTEAPEVPYQTVYEITQRVLSIIKHPLLFVATDDENFLIYIKSKFPKLVIAQNALRSQDGTPIHSQQVKNNYKKGEEALLDCLILSKCNTIIKTSSNLSDASIKFNPSIPCINLNKSYIQDKL